MVSGRALDGTAPGFATPGQPASTPSGQADPVVTDPAAGAAPAARPEITDLPEWAQTLIKDTREEAARTRVDAKAKAAEEAAVAATKKVTEDIGRALGLITDDTPPEEQLTPEQLQELLSGERTSTKMARTELAVFKAATSGQFNASALLDSRSFLDAVKEIDPGDHEKIGEAIAAAVEANPWLKATAPTAAPQGAPPVDPAAPATPPAAPAATPPVAPPGGTFAGGPGGRNTDLSSMSIDDFRAMRRNNT
jgi:hypothetical protein